MHPRIFDRMLHRRVLAAGLLTVLALLGGCDSSSDPVPPPLPPPGEDRPLSQDDTGNPGGEDRDANGQADSDSDDREMAEAVAAADQKPGFTADRLEQLVAPIALYPDQLLQQVLMAATYPAEVAEAGAWVKANPRLNGKALDDAIADKGWDVSVNSLVHATQALELMNADPAWTRDLGDAFLAQQDDVLNAVQVMRSRAADLGNLKTTAQQQVIIEDAPRRTAPTAQPQQQYRQGDAAVPLGSSGQQYAQPDQYAQQPYGSAQYAQPVAGYYVVPPPPRIVRIVPTSQNYMYVPTYNPRVIYGATTYQPYYPQVYSYPQAQVGIAPVISFGLGLAMGNLIWGDVDWDNCRVYRTRYGRGYYGGDRDWYNNRANWNQAMWRHDNYHRRGVTYSRPEYGNVWGYRDRYQERNDKQYRDWEKQARKDQERYWKEQGKHGGKYDGRYDGRYGRPDDRWGHPDQRRSMQDNQGWQEQQRKDADKRAKDDDKRWQQQEKQDRKDADQRAKAEDKFRQQQEKLDRKEADQRAKDADRQRQQQEKQQRNDADRRAKDEQRQDRDQQKNQPKDQQKGQQKDQQRDSRDVNRGNDRAKDAPKGGGWDNGRGGNDHGGKSNDRGQAMKPDRGGNGNDRGQAMKPDRGSNGNDRGQAMKPDRGNERGGHDPRGGGGGQQQRGGNDRGSQDRGGNDRGGNSSKGGGHGGNDRGNGKGNPKDNGDR